MIKREDALFWLQIIGASWSTYTAVNGFGNLLLNTQTGNTVYKRLSDVNKKYYIVIGAMFLIVSAWLIYLAIKNKNAKQTQTTDVAVGIVPTNTTNPVVQPPKPPTSGTINTTYATPDISQQDVM